MQLNFYSFPSATPPPLPLHPPIQPLWITLIGIGEESLKGQVKGQTAPKKGIS